MITNDSLSSLIKSLCIQTLESLGLLKPVFRYGYIDPSYTTSRPKIIFDGENGIVSTKPYPYCASYTPAANDRVICIRSAGSYVVLDKII